MMPEYLRGTGAGTMAELRERERGYKIVRPFGLGSAEPLCFEWRDLGVDVPGQDRPAWIELESIWVADHA